MVSRQKLKADANDLEGWRNIDHNLLMKSYRTMISSQQVCRASAFLTRSRSIH
jgi:hypothetical protein